MRKKGAKGSNPLCALLVYIQLDTPSVVVSAVSTVTDDDLLKFTFYKINMIANAPNPQTNATDQMWVFLKQMSGTTSCSMCRN